MTAYQQGQADFMDYKRRFGIEIARAIIDDYEQIIDSYIRHGVTIIDQIWEADYIRGARDILAYYPHMSTEAT